MAFYILLGIAIGIVGTVIWYNRRTDGFVVVYMPEDPEESPYMGFKFNKHSGEIYKRRSVRFAVKTEELNSQK